jgi:hypothetical protein
MTIAENASPIQLVATSNSRYIGVWHSYHLDSQATQYHYPQDSSFPSRASDRFALDWLLDKSYRYASRRLERCLSLGESLTYNRWVRLELPAPQP